MQATHNGLTVGRPVTSLPEDVRVFDVEGGRGRPRPERPTKQTRGMLVRIPLSVGSLPVVDIIGTVYLAMTDAGKTTPSFSLPQGFTRPNGVVLHGGDALRDTVLEVIRSAWDTLPQSARLAAVRSAQERIAAAFVAERDKATAKAAHKAAPVADLPDYVFDASAPAEPAAAADVDAQDGGETA